MVVADRLAWVRKCIAEGMFVRITASAGARHGRGKLKIHILQSTEPTSVMTRTLLWGILDAAAVVTMQNVSVDRGHMHSSGLSEVAIWVSPKPPVTTCNFAGDTSVLFSNKYDRTQSRNKSRAMHDGLANVPIFTVQKWSSLAMNLHAQKFAELDFVGSQSFTRFAIH